jgi:hypothetical protein
MKILTVSDRVDPLVHSPAIRRHFADVDFVLACGDLPYYYLEYIVTMLDTRLFYVIGNHANEVRNLYEVPEKWRFPGGCDNLDGRAIVHRGLLLAGLEGSMRYNNNPYFQYTPREMAWKMWQLAPSFLLSGHSGHPCACKGHPRSIGLVPHGVRGLSDPDADLPPALSDSWSHPRPHAMGNDRDGV